MHRKLKNRLELSRETLGKIAGGKNQTPVDYTQTCDNSGCISCAISDASVCQFSTCYRCGIIR